MADPQPETIRFERANSNELWQVDFKKVGTRKNRREAMSVLDDSRRYCIALEVVPDQTLKSAWEVLWNSFGEFGLPAGMLSDNGPAFRNNATWRWSSFDLRLMLLGIKPAHGKPYHPQTQGKVERLHGTIEREIRFEDRTDVPLVLREFRDRYNWVRPHQALDLKTPGSLYEPSKRTRPKTMPEPFFKEGCLMRRCHDPGVINYKGAKYKLGRAFTNLPVGLLHNENGVLEVIWGNFTLGPLEDLRL